MTKEELSQKERTELELNRLCNQTIINLRFTQDYIKDLQSCQANADYDDRFPLSKRLEIIKELISNFEHMNNTMKSNQIWRFLE